MAISKNNKRWLARIIFTVVSALLYFVFKLSYRSFVWYDLIAVVFIAGLSFFVFPLNRNKNSGDSLGEIDTHELDILSDTFDDIF